MVDQQSRADDASLLARSRHDSAAFAELVARHTDGIFAFVAVRVGPDAAQDIVSETFLDAFDRQDRFDSARGPVRAWLFGLASIHLLRHRDAEARWLRRAAAAAASDDAIRIGDDDHRDDRIAARADAARLAPALAEALLSLSPAERDVLVLFALEDMTHEQIAAALGIRRGTAKTRLSRGCARLRTRLAHVKIDRDTEGGPA